MDETCHYCGSIPHAIACPEHPSNGTGHRLHMRRWEAGRREAANGGICRKPDDPTYCLGFYWPHEEEDAA